MTGPNSAHELLTYELLKEKESHFLADHLPMLVRIGDADGRRWENGPQ